MLSLLRLLPALALAALWSLAPARAADFDAALAKLASDNYGEIESGIAAAAAGEAWGGGRRPAVGGARRVLSLCLGRDGVLFRPHEVPSVSRPASRRGP